MNVRQKIAVTVLLGSGVGLCGCQSPSQGGLAFWKKDGEGSVASASPDVGRQKYDGLAKEFGGTSKTSSATPLGGQRPPDDNFLTASWKKTTGAVAGAFATRPSEPYDPLRLDQPTKKLGPEVHVGAAQLMENQGKFAEAEAHYQKALQAAPNDLSALVGLARLHDRQGHSKQALEMYDRALKAHPQSGLALNDLGLCLARQKQFDTAAKVLSRAVELNPQNAKYRNNLASVLVETGSINEAVQTMSAVSPPAVAHYNVGYLLVQRGQMSEATRYFQQALAIDPSLTPAREMLAQLSGNPAAQPLTQSAPRGMAPEYETAQTPAGGYGYAKSSSQAPTSQAAVQAAASSGPQSYHLSDDAPAAETASRGTNWGSYGMTHLPPVE